MPRCWSVERLDAILLAKSRQHAVSKCPITATESRPRPGATACGPLGPSRQADSSVGENGLHRKSTGMLILAGVSSRLCSGILMIMQQGLCRGTASHALPRPRGHCFWQIMFQPPKPRSQVAGSRQRNRPPPHLEIQVLVFFSCRLLANGYFQTSFLPKHNDLNILPICSAPDACTLFGLKTCR